MRKNQTIYFPDRVMTPETCLDIIAQLKTKGLYLNRDGLFTQPQKSEMLEEDITREWNNLLTASKLVPFMVQTTSKKGLTGSYGLKHVVERALRYSYIGNGDMILVMLVLGYKVIKTEDYGGPNCSFNCKYVENDYLIHGHRFKQRF